MNDNYTSRIDILGIDLFGGVNVLCHNSDSYEEETFSTIEVFLQELKDHFKFKEQALQHVRNYLTSLKPTAYVWRQH